ncbi:MAG: prepilin-type N-terminal cleavage/methylation domain-containing protein [Stenotrophomonas sp.]
MPFTSPPTTSMPGSQRGYSLIEVSVVVGVLGVLTFAVTSGLENIQRFREQRAAIANAEAARNAVRAFALNNKRLPCPASSSSYREALPPCTQGSGWFPYETVGIAPPPERNRMKYGVYISNTSNLTAPARSASDGIDAERSGGFMLALAAAAAAPAQTSTPYYVQSSAQGSSVSCSGASSANPAFVIIAPATDLTGNNSNFEAPHIAFGTGSNCVASPAHRADAGSDDVVVAESTAELLGWITNSTR